MKLIKEIGGVRKLGLVGNNLIYDNYDVLQCFNNDTNVLKTNGYPSFIGGHIIFVYDRMAEVYNPRFENKLEVRCPEISDGEIGIDFVSKDLMIWSRYSRENTKRDYYRSSEAGTIKYLSTINFVILDKDRGLFLNKELSNPTHLRCTDEMAKTTYFEYQCPDGREIVRTSFLTCNNQLVFVENTQKVAEIVCLDLDSGDEVWREKGGLPRTFDKINSRSVLFSYDRDERYPKQATYRIVDLKNHTIKSGKAHCDFKLSNVADIKYLRTFNGDRMYFVDNQYSISGVSNAPKFGCFNIETKEVEFVQELPYKDHSSIDQIIYNEGKLFIRTTVEKLFVYEV